MIYLDNAATTFPSREVISTVTEVMEKYSGNPSSLHAAGREAAALLARSRESLAAAIGAEPDEVFFTSGGTEADNWAICGAAHLMRHRGRHIVATAVEHDAVLAPLRELESRGWEITLLRPDRAGNLDPSALRDALRPDTALVSVMLVNNETGAVHPVRALAEMTRAHSPALFHTDAVQGFFQLPPAPGELGVDLLTLSAHKLHGPKGAGALWVRPGLKLPPLLRGGGQERGLRSGTEALHNIAGFARAAELARARQPETLARLEALQRYLREELPRAVPEVQLLPPGAPHILSLSLPGWRSEVITNFLDGRGIAVSHASACKRGGRSHVLAAMGLDSRVIDGTIRVSFSGENTVEDCAALVAGLAEARQTLFPKL